MKANKKKMTVALASLLALVVLVGTWAYFTATNTIANEMLTKDYGVKTVEEFTPKQELEPGKTITKEAGVTNIGGYALVVRFKLDEKWERSGTSFISHDSTATPVTNAIASVVYNGAVTPPTYTANQANDTDGSTAGDESVMYKDLKLTGWTKGSDGYWYYTTLLDAGATTGNFLESLTMATNTDMGLYTTQDWYSTKSKSLVEAELAALSASATEAQKDACYAWTVTKPTDESTITYIKSDKVLDPDNSGYANADYTLTITTEVCQATKDAVEATWNMTAAEQQAILTAWNLK